jgi:hypothetical protein
LGEGLTNSKGQWRAGRKLSGRKWRKTTVAIVEFVPVAFSLRLLFSRLPGHGWASFSMSDVVEDLWWSNVFVLGLRAAAAKTKSSNFQITIETSCTNPLSYTIPTIC